MTFFHSSVVAMSLFLSAIQSAHADGGLAVLGHDRGAVPARSVIGELLERFGPDPEEVLPDPPSRQTIDPARAVPQSGYPVVSSLSSSVGLVGVKEIDLPLSSPVCVIGPDAASLRWLSRNRSKLIKVGASCILVRARDAREAERVRAAARPIPVRAVPFDELARIHGIRTVPVLLVGKGALR